jgi:hypothetical protein
MQIRKMQNSCEFGCYTHARTLPRCLVKCTYPTSYAFDAVVHERHFQLILGMLFPYSLGSRAPYPLALPQALVCNVCFNKYIVQVLTPLLKVLQDAFRSAKPKRIQLVDSLIHQPYPSTQKPRQHLTMPSMVRSLRIRNLPLHHNPRALLYRSIPLYRPNLSLHRFLNQLHKTCRFLNN